MWDNFSFLTSILVDLQAVGAVAQKVRLADITGDRAAAGLHDIRLVTPDGVSVERQVRVRAGEEINVGIDLR